MRASDVLRKAGDVIRERGWCQGSFESDSGAVCIWGAVRVVNDWGWSDDAMNPVRYILDTNEAEWNDTNGRTFSEAVALIDAAYILQLQIEGEDPADYEVL